MLCLGFLNLILYHEHFKIFLKIVQNHHTNDNLIFHDVCTVFIQSSSIKKVYSLVISNNQLWIQMKLSSNPGSTTWSCLTLGKLLNCFVTQYLHL